MDRRTFVQRAGSIALAGSVAGCSSVTGGLSVSSVNHYITSFGNVALMITVENSASDRRSGTVLGQVDVDGGQLYTKRRPVTVAGNDFVSLEMSFDIALSESLSGNQFTYSAQIV